MTKREIKKEREWNHWLYWLPKICVDELYNPIDNYDPEQYELPNG